MQSSCESEPRAPRRTCTNPWTPDATLPALPGFQPALHCLYHQKAPQVLPKTSKMPCHKDLEWHYCHNREAAVKVDPGPESKCHGLPGLRGAPGLLRWDSRAPPNHNCPKGMLSLQSLLSALYSGCGHQTIAFGSAWSLGTEGRFPGLKRVH